MNELRAFFKDYKEKQAAYAMALNTMYYDLHTIAPKKGMPKRNKAMAILSGEAFRMATDPDALKQIEALAKQSDDPQEQRELQLFLKGMQLNRVLPKEVYIAMRQIQNDSETAWYEAKQQNQYDIFEPHLKAIIQKQKEVLSYLKDKTSDYDYLLDSYEDGMNVETYDAFFKAIKESLVPLIKEIQEKGKHIDDSILLQCYDVEKQAAFNAQLLDYLKMDHDKCILGLTEHPFTDFFSDNEARITTHYYEHMLMSGIFSTIHEYGHALYSLQVDPTYDQTALKDQIGYAMHESQSRFMENHIGRHRALWEVQFPILQSYFPEQLKDVSLDAFMEMINVSKPSLIRTEADELTYPLHILIRYELEKELFNGHVNLDELETMWNDKYEEYLGIRPDNTSEGILQDMHWGAGNFGYFPTYALGSAYAAQFYDAMSKQIDVADCLKKNHFEEIAAWLQEHVHRFGAYQKADDILLHATGKPFDPSYYIEYLTSKYRKLYALD